MQFQRVDKSTHNELLRAAMLAPAIGHTKGWSLRFRHATVEVYRDPVRSAAAGQAPPGVLESIGAAIFNLRTAAAHLGFHGDVQILADDSRPLKIATVTLTRCGRMTCCSPSCTNS